MVAKTTACDSAVQKRTLGMMVRRRVENRYRLSRFSTQTDPRIRAGWRACALLMLLLVGLGSTAAAQAIRGTVADENGAPVTGAIVVLVDSTGKPVAGALAGSRGEFHVVAPAAGRYAIRVDRVGHASDLSERIDLATGAVVERTIIARGFPVQLAGVVISKTRRCVSRPEEGTAIAKVWDEARKALSAADLAGNEGLLRVRVARYERDLDRGKRVKSEQRSQREGVTKNPFVSIPPESLATGGFVQTAADGTWYFAPDAHVLVSEEFLDNYCFRLRRGRGRTASMIGVAFEPAKTNALPGIQGVLWVDKRTAELRHADYVYTRLPGGVESRDVGGRIEFRRLPNGIWLVQRWRIRMPVIQVFRAAFRRQADLGLETSLGNPVVVGFREEGGEVLEIMGRSGWTFAAREGRIRGIVYDSTRSAALGGAEVSLMGTAFVATTGRSGEFDLQAVPEGEYTLSFSHPQLDTLGIVHPGTDVSVSEEAVTRAVVAIPSMETMVSVLCPGARGAGLGALIGIVRDERGNPVAGAAIRASWSGRWTGDARTVLQATVHEGSTRSEQDGHYRMCGVPLDEIVEIFAAAPGGSSTRVRIPARREPFFVANVRLPEAAAPAIAVMDPIPDARTAARAGGVSVRHEAGAGILHGTVTDSAGRPIEAAQVRLVGSGIIVRTLPDGSFSVALPPGSHVVDVRRLGYVPASFTAEAGQSQDVVAAIRLDEAVQRLESMVIAEERGTSASAAPGFAERKRRLNAVFVDRQRIDREHPLELTDLLRGAPGIRLQPMKSLMGVTYVPQMRRATALDGHCPMSYYVDGMEFEPSEQGINADVRPAEIEAIEVYQPSQVPAQFSSARSAKCGVLVIWTRQEAGKVGR